MKTVVVLVAVLALALPADAILDRTQWIQNFQDENALCSLDCIHDIFEEHCSGMPCLTTQPSKRTLKKLCVDTCFIGLIGKEMKRCLRRGFPENKDTHSMMQLLLFEAFQYCRGVVVVSEPHENLEEVDGLAPEEAPRIETIAELIHEVE